jgi:hypothetical protein
VAEVMNWCAAELGRSGGRWGRYDGADRSGRFTWPLAAAGYKEDFVFEQG